MQNICVGRCSADKICRHLDLIQTTFGRNNDILTNVPTICDLRKLVYFLFFSISKYRLARFMVKSHVTFDYDFILWWTHESFTLLWGQWSLAQHGTVKTLHETNETFNHISLTVYLENKSCEKPLCKLRGCCYSTMPFGITLVWNI